MSKDNAISLRRQDTLLRLNEHLLVRARVFYLLGFFPDRLSASQMAAVTDCLHGATSLDSAKSTVVKFLDKQLAKLKNKESRTGKRVSWLKETTGTGGEDSLGKTLILWVENEKYLVEPQKTDENIRLAALRRFWATAYGLYRYKRIFGKDMSWWEEGS